MPITQIRLGDPGGETTSPSDSQALSVMDGPISPEDLHKVPILILQLQDELTRSRRREALWLSIILHMLVVAALLLGPKYLPHRNVVLLGGPADLASNRELTFLEAPPDRQIVERAPNSNVISDKNRIAMSRNPRLDRNDLKKILDSSRPGAPGQPAAPSAPPAQQAAQPAQQQPQQAAGDQQQRGDVQTPPVTSQSPALEATQRGGSSPRNVFGNPGNMSAGSMINQATRAASSNRVGGGGFGGDYGSLTGGGSGAAVRGNMEVLSDTMGVDFGPYLARVLHDVKQNWYLLIPEVARAPLLKKGKVAIEFAITKDGKVAGLRMAGGSGDASLDRAAWGGITASDPFPPLPGEFRGPYLALRFHFFYNPDKNDLR